MWCEGVRVYGLFWIHSGLHIHNLLVTLDRHNYIGIIKFQVICSLVRTQFLIITYDVFDFVAAAVFDYFLDTNFTNYKEYRKYSYNPKRNSSVQWNAVSRNIPFELYQIEIMTWPNRSPN